MIRKGYVITSLISAMVGAALVWFAAGDRQDRVIDDWIPLNMEIAAAVSLQETAAEPQVETTTPPEAVPATTDTIQTPAPAETAVTLPLQTSQLENAAAVSNVISINTASMAELMEIPGIGEKKAQAIIEYRTSHGLFKTVEDLTKVKGIGDKMLEKMKPHIGL
ncbi:ComEA family DNA-binding protein [Paenibacillus brevis]|nr:helix-hairpin-helix domain-containing protein [Paenibacillus brevis]